MKNYILKSLTLILIASYFAACGPVDDKEAIQEQIKAYKEEVSQLNIQIRELEKQLENMNISNESFLVPVEIYSAEYRPFNHYFQVSGTVDADEKAYISPEINGQIQVIAVERGSRVKQGDLILKLNTDVTEKSMAEIETSLDLAKRVFRKQEDLWEQNIGDGPCDSTLQWYH